MKKISIVLCALILIFACSGQILLAQVEAGELTEDIGKEYSFTGYFNVTDMGLLIGSNENSHPAPFSFMVFNGIHITEQFSTSLGIGVEFPSGSYMPLVLDTRYYFRNTNFSPFVQLYGGYTLALDDNSNQGIWYDTASSSMPSYYRDYEPYTAHGGWLLNPGFGIRSLFGENFGVVFSVGYRVQRLYYSAGDDRERIVDYNRLAIKIGITFR